MDFDWFTIGGILLILIGIAAFFMGKGGSGGMTPERGQMLLAVGVIGGILLVAIGWFV